MLLTWFPGQAGGAALADVLLGREEPGGRLPTTWPDRLADCPVVNTAPHEGVLRYDEGVFIGYRAWAQSDTAPAYWFGHGLGYTTWVYESMTVEPTQSGLASVRVVLRNDGDRAGRDTVQVYLSPAPPDPQRPQQWLAGFVTVDAEPGEQVVAEVIVPERAISTWDEHLGWQREPGDYAVLAGRSYADLPLSAPLRCAGP